MNDKSTNTIITNYTEIIKDMGWMLAMEMGRVS